MSTQPVNPDDEIGGEWYLVAWFLPLGALIAAVHFHRKGQKLRAQRFAILQVLLIVAALIVVL